MFNRSYEEPKQPKKPTLRQWIKSLPKKERRGLHTYGVETIWVPNVYDNYTLVTSRFRIVAPKGAELYEVLREYLTSDAQEFTSLIGIKIVDFEKVTFELVELSTRGKYETFYGSNFRWRTGDK